MFKPFMPDIYVLLFFSFFFGCPICLWGFFFFFFFKMLEQYSLLGVFGFFNSDRIYLCLPAYFLDSCFLPASLPVYP